MYWEHGARMVVIMEAGTQIPSFGRPEPLAVLNLGEPPSCKPLEPGDGEPKSSQ